MCSQQRVVWLCTESDMDCWEVQFLCRQQLRRSETGGSILSSPQRVAVVDLEGRVRRICLNVHKKCCSFRFVASSPFGEVVRVEPPRRVATDTFICLPRKPHPRDQKTRVLQLSRSGPSWREGAGEGCTATCGSATLSRHRHLQLLESETPYCPHL